LSGEISTPQAWALSEMRRDEFAAVEDRSVVARGLVELAPRQRTALVLTELIGFSSDEAPGKCSAFAPRRFARSRRKGGPR
jgi:DNA-directed RNA polymerase specialized sigma24 family protein